MEVLTVWNFRANVVGGRENADSKRRILESEGEGGGCEDGGGERDDSEGGRVEPGRESAGAGLEQAKLGTEGGDEGDGGR